MLSSMWRWHSRMNDMFYPSYWREQSMIHSQTPLSVYYGSLLLTPSVPRMTSCRHQGLLPMSPLALPLTFILASMLLPAISSKGQIGTLYHDKGPHHHFLSQWCIGTGSLETFCGEA